MSDYPPLRRPAFGSSDSGYYRPLTPSDGAQFQQMRDAAGDPIDEHTRVKDALEDAGASAAAAVVGGVIGNILSNL